MFARATIRAGAVTRTAADPWKLEVPRSRPELGKPLSQQKYPVSGTNYRPTSKPLRIYNALKRYTKEQGDSHETLQKTPQCCQRRRWRLPLKQASKNKDCPLFYKKTAVNLSLGLAALLGIQNREKSFKNQLSSKLIYSCCRCSSTYQRTNREICM